MKVLHVSTECYPAAKAGGMGDVVGALPLYSEMVGIEPSVIIPMYGLQWFANQEFEEVFSSSFLLGEEKIEFQVLLTMEHPSYNLYCISIPGKFDRNSIYLAEDGEGFKDEIERNVSFQTAVLHWLNSKSESFDVIHCHDHQAGLIPFFMAHGNEFENLRFQSSYFTIHNAAYKGMWDWKHRHLLPGFNEEHIGLLDWDNHIHSFASAVRCCWGYNTVSPSYLEEISHNSGNLNWLFDNTKDKATGILNGIDINAWDPSNDPMIDFQLKRSWKAFKKKNKDRMCEEFGFKKSWPLFSFIGRFAYQKGADILAESIEMLVGNGENLSFIVLGSGSHELENKISGLESKYPENVKALIMYNEAIAHKIYAASDFIVMPSRFEPCGLNQMFAYRYGAIPLVRSTGGLIDSVTDINQGGAGIRFENANAVDLKESVLRAQALYKTSQKFDEVRANAVKQNFSWERSLHLYKNEYKKILDND
ncbi:MAG: glycogen synthase [Saprospiraceae bacterium]|nr:glycogen synthase [Bacteroidia bacterium]MBT8230619.1 glycogen synthase [Bacteroidia bacterium]NNF22143.1 glycogen synthase [Saprospiraceae bacterium]